MQKHNLDILLNVGSTSLDRELQGYYQNFAPAIVHFSDKMAHFDDNGIPYTLTNGEINYSIIQIIQYGLICNDLLVQKSGTDNYKQIIKSCLDWLDNKKEVFNDSYVWRNGINLQYKIDAGWISGMIQGQAMSLYLRGYQIFGNQEYLLTADMIYKSFKYEYSKGGFKRNDEYNCIWFEEYPTSKPSYVLNGFIYAMFGVLDYYRVTENKDALRLWDSCVHTLDVNLPKYDIWYWSVYDQLKKELVSYYYQKNVHIPLMQIMYGLSQKEIFNFYAVKWEKSLNNPIHRLVTKIMYRIQPRLKKLERFLRKKIVVERKNDE